jgi:SAM-dependent methyltransferase
LSADAILCPVCKSAGSHLFFSQRHVPTQCGYLATSRHEAMRCELGDIILRHCASCGHVWNSAFDPGKLRFDSEYDFSQYHSEAYRSYVQNSIQRLKTRYGFDNGTALDVACGKGEYLRMLVRAGFSRAFGFDPTFAGAELDEHERQCITIYRKYYDESASGLAPDLVTCRSALQYIRAPRGLLSSIRRSLEGRTDTIVYFEVPNGNEAFRERIVWYVMYEAGCFFSMPSLARIFRECGFQVLDVLPALGSSQLEIEARPAATPGPHAAENEDLIAEVGRSVEGFAATYAARVREWSHRFERYRAEGKRVVLWAAGMRAISLLVNVPQAASLVEFVVDVNPERQGRYLPKTGQRVIGPASLHEIKPDVVIATNPNYAKEIEAQLRSMGLRCDFDSLR